MSEAIPPNETPAARRNRLLRDGKNTAANIASECLEEIFHGEVRAHHEVGAAVRRACQGCYEIGIETMGDIALPQVADAELAAMEARAEVSADHERDAAAVARLRALPAETVALAINGVIRHLLTDRAAWALRGAFSLGQFTMPVEEARAMAATVEAALGLDLSKLDHTDLFDLRA